VGSIRVGLRRWSQEAGFDHHLIKPADIGALQVPLAALAALAALEARADAAHQHVTIR
jgi:hypothetical protein